MKDIKAQEYLMPSMPILQRINSSHRSSCSVWGFFSHFNWCICLLIGISLSSVLVGIKQILAYPMYCLYTSDSRISTNIFLDSCINTLKGPVYCVVRGGFNKSLRIKTWMQVPINGCTKGFSWLWFVADMSFMYINKTESCAMTSKY